MNNQKFQVSQIYLVDLFYHNYSNTALVVTKLSKNHFHYYTLNRPTITESAAIDSPFTKYITYYATASSPNLADIQSEHPELFI